MTLSSFFAALWSRRSFATGLVVSAIALSGTASAQSPQVLRIGYQKYGTLTLLKARGDLEKRLVPHGVEVKWTEFPAGPVLLEGLNVGSIDFGTVGEAPPIFAQAAGADLVYVANQPPAPTAEAIIVPKGSAVKSVAELKGKRVALNKGSNVHYLLVKALEKAGPEIQRRAGGVPAPGRCTSGLRARRGRRLGDLGPVPCRRREAALGKRARRRHRSRE